MASSLEAKICILGAQGVGKTSLVQRYVKGTFTPSTTASTVGASFLTKRVLDDSGTLVRLQLWDTAGQERFRSISKLYYRGASAVVLVYSIVDEQSFQEMGRWMQEVKENTEDGIVIHVVGTKSDVVAQHPGRRMVTFEQCIAYVADNLFSNRAAASPPAAAGSVNAIHSLDSKRSSGFWGQDHGWDCCHEISARDGEGIDEVFRVITRKLVEAKVKRAEQEQAREAIMTPGNERSQAGYFDGPASDGRGSFKVGAGDKRRSWLGFPTSPNITGEERNPQTHDRTPVKQGKCC
ncbi:MAG: hypothetical protein Q9168_003405 [Polycauliona sp. 1 TL-2023]